MRRQAVGHQANSLQADMPTVNDDSAANEMPAELTVIVCRRGVPFDASVAPVSGASLRVIGEDRTRSGRPLIQAWVVRARSVVELGEIIRTWSRPNRRLSTQLMSGWRLREPPGAVVELRQYTLEDQVKYYLVVEIGPPRPERIEDWEFSSRYVGWLARWYLRVRWWLGYRSGWTQLQGVASPRNAEEPKR